MHLGSSGPSARFYSMENCYAYVSERVDGTFMIHWDSLNLPLQDLKFYDMCNSMKSTGTKFYLVGGVKPAHVTCRDWLTEIKFAPPLTSIDFSKSSTPETSILSWSALRALIAVRTFLLVS